MSPVITALDNPVLDDPILDLLGMTPGELVVNLGAPIEIGTLRGTEPKFDSVFFFYEGDRLYIFWYAQRVWQIRFDEKSKAQVFGISMGMTKNEIISFLGAPLEAKDNYLTYRVKDQGFPLRASLYFSSDKLNEIYIYRSDL